MWRLTGAFAALFMAACQMASLPSGGPVRQMALAGGTLTAPDGYCLDPLASRPAENFALMASCARFAGVGALPALDAMATVQIGAEGSAAVAGAEDAMAGLFATPPGRALLSGRGQAGSVSAVSSKVRPGLVQVRFLDTASHLAGTGPTWRSFFDHGGRLVTVSVRAARPGGLNKAGAEVLLSRIGGRLITRNAPE